MVAIVASNGLGLFNASNNILGAAGVLGSSALGQFGGRGYVNAVTGNLVLQAQDEQLSGRGADLLHLRTYNSLGQLSDGDADNWRWEGERTLVLTGARNTTGSKVTRTTGDGSVTDYVWNGSIYVSHDGDGADDTVSFDNSAAQQWVFIDGSSRREERYNGVAATTSNPARLATQKETNGSSISFGYDGNGRLITVLDNSKLDGSGAGSNQKLVLTYGVVPDSNPSVTRLLKVETFSLVVDGAGRATGTVGAAVRQVEYGYDTKGRLTSVTTDLTPNITTDNSDPNTLYKTTYAYTVANSTDTRIASITQSNGTVASGFVYASFTYEQAPGSGPWRVKTVTDANGTQTFTYNSGNTEIKFSDDAAGTVNVRTWKYTYDTAGQLKRVDSPAPTSGAAPLVTLFDYDASGNVTQVTDARGFATTYKYDERGNRTIERDAEGNTISRTFSTTNQVRLETRYKDVDTNGEDSTLPAIPLTTRYVYDEATQTRLLFIVSAEGRVTENRYGTDSNGYGLLVRSIQYAASRYDVGSLSPAVVLTEGNLTAWLALTATDKAQVQQSRYEYDLRGNLSRRTDYGAATAAGEGTLDATGTVTDYIYDAHGALLQTIAVRGAARNQPATLTSVAYDGMGRIIQTVGSNGTQTTTYNDITRTITVTENAGAVGTKRTISTYDTQGRTLSVSMDGTFVDESGATQVMERPATQYRYDAQGRLRMVEDGLGARSFSFYDEVGRLQYQVDATGAVTGYEYKATGQVAKVTRYAIRATTASWVNSSGVITKNSLTVGAAGSDVVVDSKDRVTLNDYDKAGRLITQTDGASVVTTISYDGASRMTQQQTGARVTRYFYDRDGQQVGMVDPLGYLTERKYDAAGRLVETVRYTTRSPAASNLSAPVWSGVANQNATGTRPFVYHMPAAFDDDGETITYSVVGTLPTWLNFDAVSLTLSGTPPKGFANYDVTLRARDARGAFTDATMRISVVNAPPSWATLSDVTAVANASGFSLVLPVATDIDSTAAQLTYSINAALLPPGLAFNAATRTISGTPTVPGTYNVTARVTDNGTPPLSTERTFVLQVTNKGPTWNATIATQTAPRAEAWTFGIPAAVDPEGQALTYRIVSGPAWLSFVNSSRSVTGTPPANERLGLQAIVLEAQDTFGETVRLTFSVNITNVAPTWASLPTQSLPAGNALNFTPPAATDREGSTITYSVVSGSLPAGTTLNPTTGRIGGTTNGSDVRSYSLVLRATDADGGFVDRTLTINLLNSPPVYSRGISNLTVPRFNFDGFVIPPDAFTDVNGDVLTYSIPGAIPGLRPPNATGLYFAPTPTGSIVNYADPGSAVGTVITVTVNCTDARGATSSRNFTITITAAPPAPTPQPPDPGTPTGPRPPGGGPGGGGGGGNPPQEPIVGPGHGPASAPLDPIEPAPKPVLGPAPEPEALAAITPAPAPLQALVPLEDVLVSWRPSDSRALHSYEYYDGQGRLVGSVDDRGFLTETVYDAHGNTQQSVRYMKFVTVADSDTLATLKTQALRDGGQVEITTTAFDSMGRVDSVTNVDGTVTRYEYDSVGRLVRQVQAAGTSEERVTRTRYNALGDVAGTLGGEGNFLLNVFGYTLDEAIARFGMRYSYDALGHLIRTTDAKNPDATQPDANGNSSLNFYDADGRLTHTVNAKGEVSETLYNAFGEVQSTRLYNTRLTAAQLAGLTGGANGALLSVLTVDANKDRVTSRTYDQRGLLSSSTDARGFVTSNTYTTFGQLATQIRTILQGSTPVRTTTQFGYDLDGRLLVQTSDVGGINFNSQIGYDAYGRVIRSVDGAGNITTTNYDRDSGRTIEVTDALNRTVRSEYDAFNRVLKVTDAAGQNTIYSYDDALRSVRVTTPAPEAGIAGIIVTTVRTRTGEIQSIVDGRQNSVDSSRVTTAYTYNADGRLTGITDALGHVIVANTYDNRGRLNTTMDARGIVTKYGYDEANRVVIRRVDTATGGLNLTTKYEFDALGQQVTVTEGFGTAAARATSYSYYLDGRLKQVVVDPSGLRLATTYDYDGLGNTISVAQGTVASPNQQVTQYVFDKLGRRVKEIVAPSAVFGAGSARTRDLTTEYRYDAAGRMTRRIDANGQSTWYVYDAVGQLKQTVNALGEVSETTYDANGRVVQTRSYVDRLSSGTINAFGDSINAVTPTPRATDRRSYFVYDSNGRQRFTVQAENLTFWSIAENRFDANGNVVETRRYDKVVNDADADATKALDTSAAALSLTQVQSVLRALGYSDTALGSSSTNESTLAAVARTRSAYDANNRLRFTVDALGGVTERVYDNAGNVLTNVRYATPVSLTADEARSETSINGRVNRGNSNNQVTQFAYDAAGRLRYTVRVLVGGDSPQQLVSRQTYNELGQAVQTIDYATPLGTLSNYDASTLDTAVAVASVANSVENRTTAYAYDTAGRRIYSVQLLLSLDNAGNVVTRYLVSQQTYDAMSHAVQTTTYARLLDTLANYDKATLDTAVNASAMANNAQNRSTRFAYDEAGRLRFVVAADGALSETVYDALGQVTEQRQFDLLVSSPTPLSSITDAYLTGLRADRKVGDGVTRGERRTYDAAGRVLSVSDANSKTEFNEYDGLGNLIKFTDKNGNVADDTTKWLYTYDRMGRVFDKNTPVARFRLSDDTASTVEPRSLRTRFNYDAFGNLTRKVEAFGTVDARVTDYGYDTLGRQTSMSLPGFYDTVSGRVLATAVSGGTSFVRTLETRYDALGNAVRTKLRTGVSSYQYEYNTYDNLGRVLHDVDALSNVTLFTYNAFGEQKEVKRFSKTAGTPPDGVDTLWTVATLTAALGSDGLARTVTMRYDTLGRKTDVIQPTSDRYFYSSTSAASNATSVTGATDAAAITHYDYNAFGEVAHEALKLDSVGTDALGRPGHWRDTWHYFDAMGREIRTVDAAGYHTARTYDALGNVTEVVEYANAGALGVIGTFTPPITPVENGSDRIVAFTYDALNRQLTLQRKNLRYSSLQGDGSYAVQDTGRGNGATIQRLTYDNLGRVRTQTDALSNVTTNEYDALGQLISITEPARTIGGSIFDPFRDQADIAPVTSFTYNAFGQVLKQVRPTGRAGNLGTLTIQTSYDLAGNAIGTTDANGNVKNRKYDYAGRLTEETQDINSILSWRTSTGTSVTWRTVAYTLKRRYAYDALGRQTSVTDVFKDAANVMQQSGQGSVYNAFGEVTDELRVWGLETTAAAALKKARVTHYDYDNAGQVRLKRSGEGVTQFYYNLAGQTTRVEQLNDAATADGSVTRITETGYDVLGRATIQRLPSFTSPVIVIFDGPMESALITPISEQTFDRWGNVTSRSQGGFVINAEAGSGDISQRVTTFYEYNHDNQVTVERLPTVTAYRADRSSYQANVTHSVRYDVLGRAVQELDTVPEQTNSLRTRSRTYNAAGQVISETDATQHTTRYVYDANGNRIGTMNAAGTVFVDSFDNNGNLLSHGFLRKTDNTAYNGLVDSGVTSLVTLNTYRYDAANRRIASEAKVVDIADSALGNWTFTQYDERNFAVANYQIRLLTRSFDNLEAVEAGRLANTCTYDVFGNKISETDAANNTQRWDYNWIYNWVYNDDPNVADYTVGRLTRATQVAATGDKVTDYRYTDFGQVWKELYTDADMTSGAANDRIYTYFENGLLKTLDDRQSYGVVNTQNYWRSTDRTQYSYTVKGERSDESFHHEGVYGVNSSNGQAKPLSTVDRLTHIDYDAQGRIEFVSSRPPAGTRSGVNSLDYRYDELGNRREIIANYTPRLVRPDATIVEPTQTSDKWYDYDAEGRMTVVDGEVDRGQFVIGHGTTRVTYDVLGRRRETVKWDSQGHYDNDLPSSEDRITAEYDNYRKERYTYNELNYLKQVEQAIWEIGSMQTTPPHGVPGTPEAFSAHENDWLVTATHSYNLLGEKLRSDINSNPVVATESQDPLSFRLSTQAAKIITNTFDARGMLVSQATQDVLDNTKSSLVDNTIDDFGVLRSYTYKQGVMTNVAGVGLRILTPTFTNTYTYLYTLETGGYKEKKITISSTQSAQNGDTVNRYDARGNLVRQTIDNFTSNQRQEFLFAYDGDAHIIAKDTLQTNRSNSGFGSATANQDYFYAVGQQVGVVGSGDLASTTQFNSLFTPISDSYPGISPGSYTVRTGDTLASIAQLVFGDSSLWYLIGEANGLSFGPTQSLSADIGKSYHIPNVVANVHNNATTFRPYNAGSIIGSGVPAPMSVPPPPPTQCITGTQIAIVAFVVAVAIVTTVATQGAAASVMSEGVLGTMAAAGIGAAAGSAAAQLTTIALTDKKIGDFSGRQVLESGVTAALGAFVGAAAAASYSDAAGQLTMAGRAFDAAGNFFTQAAVHSIIANEFDNNSFYNLGAQVASAALLNRAYQKLDTQNFKFGGQLGQFAMGAVGPGGWVYKDESRNWGRLISEAVNAGARIGVGGVIAKIRTPAETQTALQPVWVPEDDDLDPATTRLVSALAEARQRELAERSAAGDSSDLTLYGAPVPDRVLDGSEERAMQAREAEVQQYKWALTQTLGKLQTPEERAAFIRKNIVIESVELLDMTRKLDPVLEGRYQQAYDAAFNYRNDDGAYVPETYVEQLNMEAATHVGSAFGRKAAAEQILKQAASAPTQSTSDTGSWSEGWPRRNDWHDDMARDSGPIISIAANPVGALTAIAVGLTAERAAVKLGVSEGYAALIGFGVGAVGGLALPRLTKGLGGYRTSGPGPLRLSDGAIPLTRLTSEEAAALEARMVGSGTAAGVSSPKELIGAKQQRLLRAGDSPSQLTNSEPVRPRWRDVGIQQQQTKVPGSGEDAPLSAQQIADLEMFTQRSAAPASGPVQFGQIGVSPEFSKAGAFKGALVSDVAKAIGKDISPDDIVVNVVRWDGQYVAVNNRSLTALSEAGFTPTNVVDITGNMSRDLSNPDNVFAMVQRLREMNFQPSPQIGVRAPNSNWQSPPKYFVKIPGSK